MPMKRTRQRLERNLIGKTHSPGPVAVFAIRLGG